MNARCAGKGCAHQSECWLRNHCQRAVCFKMGKFRDANGTPAKTGLAPSRFVVPLWAAWNTVTPAVASLPPRQSLGLPDELFAQFPAVDGHLRPLAGHARAHAAVGLVELGFGRVVGLASFLVGLV